MFCCYFNTIPRISSVLEILCFVSSQCCKHNFCMNVSIKLCVLFDAIALVLNMTILLPGGKREAVFHVGSLKIERATNS